MNKIAVRYDVSGCRTPEELLEVTKLNWEPEIRRAGHGALATVGPVDSDATATGCDAFRAIVNPRTGRALAYVSPRFRTNSHVKAVNDMWGLVRHGSAVPHAVSVWDGGGKMALQFRCPDLDVAVGSKSVVSPLLTLVVNHDAMAADRGFFLDTDFFCKNQMGAVAKVQGDGVRHSSGIITRYEDLLESRIRSMREGMGDRYATMKRMAETNVQLRGKALVSYFAHVLDFAPTSVDESFKSAHQGEVLSAEGKVLKALVSAWREADHDAAATPWHAFSAVTRYTTHSEGRNEATRMQRAMFGCNDRYVRAFEAAAALVSP